MTWDEVQGQWRQMKTSARRQFDKLTDGDLEMIGGQREKFISKLQERYACSRDDAQKRADEWLRVLPAQSQAQQQPPPPPRQYGDAAAHSQKR